jgi:hypothetical protein
MEFSAPVRRVTRAGNGTAVSRRVRRRPVHPGGEGGRPSFVCGCPT